MGKRKLTKRLHLVVSQSESKYEAHWSRVEGVGQVYCFHQYFALMWKHRNGSTRPEGWFHSPYGDIRVDVTWSWEERLGWYAPKIELRPHRLSAKIVAKVTEALQGHLRDDGPDGLIERLGATVVTFAADNNRGDEELYDDYRPLRVPGEPAMVTLARYAL